MPKNKLANPPLVLVILDGWGIAPASKGNALSQAKTPTVDGLIRKYPSTELYAHGKHVGLPARQVGNSEAGHMNIGAGMLVEQDSIKISKSISNGTFNKNSAFLGAIRHVKKMNSKIHLIGMLSNGQSPHSDPGHLYALLNLIKKHGIDNVLLHIFTDGRDSPKYASLNLIDELESHFFKNERIATIMGRFYAMDRKKKWSRTEKAYDALVLGKGRTAKDAKDAITESYNRGDSDEYIEPYIIESEDGSSSKIEDGDSVIFFNLRSDRSRQLSKAFVQSRFYSMNPGSFKRKKKFQHLYFVAMTDFGPDLDDILTAFPTIDLKNTMPVVLKNYRQLYLAETEKYAHVTYFFNGGYSGTVAGEDQLMVPSPDVKSYDEVPEMSSKKLTEIVVENIKKNGKKESWNYDTIVMNYAAPDMIGHTGNLRAGVQCVEALDKYISKIIKAYLSVNGTVVLTADHGNIEEMINLKTGEIYTQHTTNKVPFVIVNKKLQNKIKLRKGGSLGDIVPTVLELLKIKKPSAMRGKSLIK